MAGARLPKFFTVVTMFVVIQYGTCFMLCFWHPEFWCGFCIFWNLWTPAL